LAGSTSPDARLLAGVPVQVVAARLGYADPSITLRVDAHVISEQLAEAAEIFAQAIASHGQSLLVTDHAAP
jgi:hypothetical protein